MSTSVGASRSLPNQLLKPTPTPEDKKPCESVYFGGQDPFGINSVAELSDREISSTSSSPAPSSFESLSESEESPRGSMNLDYVPTSKLDIHEKAQTIFNEISGRLKFRYKQVEKEFDFLNQNKPNEKSSDKDILEYKKAWNDYHAKIKHIYALAINDVVNRIRLENFADSDAEKIMNICIELCLNGNK